MPEAHGCGPSPKEQQQRGLKENHPWNRIHCDPKAVFTACAFSNSRRTKRNTHLLNFSYSIVFLSHDSISMSDVNTTFSDQATPDLLRRGRWSQWRDDRPPRIQVLICFRIPEMEKTQAALRILPDTLRDRRVNQPRHHPHRGELAHFH